MGKGSRRAFLRGAGLSVLPLIGAAAAPRPAHAVELLRDLLACEFEDAAELIRLTRRQGVRVLDRRGAFLAAFGNYYAPPVPARSLPPHVVRALLVEEDRRFREHGGLDYRGIARGLYETLFGGGRQGGSTLTQQVLKNTCFQSDAADRRMVSTVWRKLKEAVTAGDLEDVLKKDGVLDVYLNSVLFGGLRDGAQIYGIQAAARAYFGKYAQALSPLEGAVLVQLLNAPNGLNPWVAPEKARRQAERLLDDMARHGAMRPAEAAAAKRAKLAVTGPEHGRPGFIPGDVRAGWFAAWARREAEALAPAGEGVTTVTSSLWPELQAIAQDELAKTFRQGKALGFDQGAALVMSHRGEVLAMVGGADYPRLQWNNATQAKRQPGSAFKLFVYLAALERGLSPSSRHEDVPLTLKSGTIRNHDDEHRGSITLAEALAHSSNPVAVRLAMGHVPRVVAVARRLGITAPLEEEVGIALGVSEVTLIELVAAYAAVANGGFLAVPNGVVEIRDNGERGVHCRRFRPPPRVIAKPHADAMRAMLAGVVRSGTGRKADPGFFAAGKTGTTDDFADAWFVGFTERFVAGVWLGNEKPTPMRGVSGSGLPAVTWREMVRRAHKLPRLTDAACAASAAARVAESP